MQTLIYASWGIVVVTLLTNPNALLPALGLAVAITVFCGKKTKD